MARLHLTDVVVQRLKTVGIYYDTTTPAFGIRIGKNRKAWVITRGTNRERVTVGQYPTMSLAEARKEAKKLLAAEPSGAPHITFEQAYERYKETLATKKPRTQRDYKRMLQKYLLPKLGKKKLPDITYEEIIDITKGLAPSEGAHCLAVGRTFFRWCVKPPRRYILHSPLEGVAVRVGKARKRVLQNDELRTVWHAAERQGYPHGTIVQLLILNGQRRGEIANLRRTWINPAERLITLPEWITKNGRVHVFPYGDMTARILDTIPRWNSTDLLFPSRVSDERPVSGWSKFKKELEDGVDGWTLHDLRRTFGTKLAELRVAPHIVERFLNHTMGSISNQADSIVSAVAEVYNLARYIPEMREAVTARWEPFLQSLLRPAA